jgi:hypothetical protein
MPNEAETLIWASYWEGLVRWQAVSVEEEE